MCCGDSFGKSGSCRPKIEFQGEVSLNHFPMLGVTSSFSSCGTSHLPVALTTPSAMGAHYHRLSPPTLYPEQAGSDFLRNTDTCPTHWGKNHEARYRNINILRGQNSNHLNTFVVTNTNVSAIGERYASRTDCMCNRKK